MNLQLPDNYNFKNDADQNISFVFGPPGTGKTTKLANEINEIQKNKKENILVLTPTNKSADVLCRKIISIEDSNFTNWLIRFGNTGAIDSDMNSIVKDRDFCYENEDSYTVISTIARLPYDGFSNTKLNEMKWDKVYFDEASMIHIAHVAYAMKRLQTEEFCFAGDPCQITPIMQFQDWQNENIYEMFELDNFLIPTTKPKEFQVTKLNKQFRSIQDIGDLFSFYAYSGQIKSIKNVDERRQLEFINGNLKPFTIIRFPVTRSERLMSPMRLKYSPYQIYSAILTVEVAKLISKKIKHQWINKNLNYTVKDDLDIDLLNKSKWTIGIISPYKAQASIIERLLPETKLDHNFIFISGTVHSFQGDECDIIISLYNTPPNISPSISLNNKNIMNVSISRAKQYLIIVLPEEEVRYYNDLKELNEIIDIIKKKYPNEYDEYKSEKMEEVLFGEKNYIQANSMITKHQKINSYNEADYRWEVRCDEEAVDLHISDQSNQP